jgi:hypothetical protein
MSGSYENTGALWVNNYKKTDKHPDFKGSVTLSKDMLKMLVERAKAGKEIKLDIGAWKKSGNDKAPVLSMKFDKPYEKEVEQNNDDIPF